MVLAEFASIESVTAEFEKDNREVQLFLHVRPEPGKARATIGIAAQQIHVGAKLRDQVDVLDVAVDDRERVVRVNRLAGRHDFVEQAVKITSLRRVLFALGQILDLEARPGQAIVAFVAECEHQHAGDVLVLPDVLLHVALQDFTRSRVRVVGERDPLAVNAVAIAAHERVNNRHDAVLAVDVRHPLWGDHAEAANRVDTGRRHQFHLVVENLADEVVRLAPQIVGVVLTTRRVAPDYALDVVVLTVDQKLPAVCILVGLNGIGLGVAHARRTQDQHYGQQATYPGHTIEEA